MGPIWSGGDIGEPALLANCYRACFAIAHQHGLRSLAFPAISCGVYGYPLRAAASIAVREVTAALAANADIEQVVFACFSDEMLAIYHELLGGAVNSGD